MPTFFEIFLNFFLLDFFIIFDIIIRVMASNNQAIFTYEKIREILLANELKPGDRLKETQWAAQLHVNRADVRQALARLHGEGLLVSGAKGGYFVREYTEAEIAEINEVRAVLETAAARLAVDRATKVDIATLYEICTIMKTLAENKLLLGLYEADLRFHHALVKAAHNTRLERLYISANLPLTNMPNIPKMNTADLDTGAQEHFSIVRALSEKNLPEMVRLLTKSLTPV